MSINLAELKVKKDAAVSALFSLWKAAGDASSATLELIDYLEGLGLDVDDLRAALDGLPDKGLKQETAREAAAAVVAAAAPESAEDASSGKDAEGSAEEPGQKRRKRASRDPNLPKRPLNVQLRFHNAEQKKIQEERKAQNLPDLTRAELRDVVKERWDKLDSKVRNELLQEHQEALEKWHAQTAAYKEHAGSVASEEPAGGLSQEPASQEPVAVPVEEATPSKKKHRKSEGKKDDKKDDKKRRKKAAAESE